MAILERRSVATARQKKKTRMYSPRCASFGRKESNLFSAATTKEWRGAKMNLKSWARISSRWNYLPERKALFFSRSPISSRRPLRNRAWSSFQRKWSRRWWSLSLPEATWSPSGSSPSFLNSCTIKQRTTISGKSPAATSLTMRPSRSFTGPMETTNPATSALRRYSKF